MNAHLDVTPKSRPLLDLKSRFHEAFSADDIAGNLWRRFDRVARRYADHPAVIDAPRTVTYGQLLDLAAGYAAHLPASSAESRSPAPVALLSRDPLMRIVGMWAALASGRPFLPIDPTAPSGRVQLMLRDSQAAAVITDDAHSAALSLFDGPIVDAPVSASGSDALAGSPATSQDPALFLYTSGSTGRPKRVVQRQGMILDSLAAYSSALRIGPDDRLSLMASPGFGEAWNDVFLALLNGAAICVREAKTSGVEGMAHWLSDADITIMHCVPTLLRAVATGLPLGTLAPRLRIVNLGGEAVSRTDVRLCVERLNPDCVVVNSYGSTETKLIAQHFVDRDSVLEAETVPVGRARSGVEIRLLSDEGTPVPQGEVGEIEVCSRSVVQGYAAGPERDRDRFIAAESARTRYRTGDLGRFNAEGLLEYLGRRDQMIKLRGYRIELSEIECLLQSHPDVRQAIVVLHESAPQVRQLVATYQSRRPIEAAETVFQELLRRRLPDYMLPARYLPFDEFPLTDTGKPDRRRLLELVGATLQSAANVPSDEASAANLTGVQRRVQRLVGEVLQIEQVRMNAGFVELGGDSLNVTELVVRLGQEFERPTTAESVLQAKTLLELSEEIEQSLSATDPPPVEPSSDAPNQGRQREK